MTKDIPEDCKAAYREWQAARDQLDDAMRKFINIEQGGVMVPFTDEDTAAATKEREAFDKFQATTWKYKEN